MATQTIKQTVKYKDRTYRANRKALENNGELVEVKRKTPTGKIQRRKKRPGEKIVRVRKSK